MTDEQPRSPDWDPAAGPGPLPLPSWLPAEAHLPVLAVIVRLMENYKRTEDMAAVAGMTGLVAPDTSRETFLSVMASLRAQMAQVKAVYEEQEQLVDELLRIVCGSG